MLVIEPWAVLIAAPVFIGAILVTRYVSLGSLLGSAALVPAMAILWLVTSGQLPPIYIAYTVVGVVLIWLAHADNIDRLLHGQERKIDFASFTGRPTSG
jgi:glycerol-3-phosphate acyltransferase PlsY